MTSKADQLAALKERRQKLLLREKILAEEIQRAEAVQNRKLCTAIGSQLLDRLNEPTIGKLLNKLVPELPPRHRLQLRSLLGEATSKATSDGGQNELKLES